VQAGPQVLAAAFGLGWQRGGRRAYRRRWRRGCQGTSRLLSAVTWVIAAGVPAAAACWSWQRHSVRTESGRAPPCMRWRGPARPRRTGWPVAWPCWRRAPPAGARHPREGPVSRLLPRSRGRPQVMPVSERCISTACAGAAQEPAAGHFQVFRYPQKNPRKPCSYPHLTAVIHELAHSLSTGSRVSAGEHRNRRYRMLGVM
jgi:hypothetical protein